VYGDNPDYKKVLRNVLELKKLCPKGLAKILTIELDEGGATLTSIEEMCKKEIGRAREIKRVRDEEEMEWRLSQCHASGL
jgi:hypothetical protein